METVCDAGHGAVESYVFEALALYNLSRCRASLHMRSPCQRLAMHPSNMFPSSIS